MELEEKIRFVLSTLKPMAAYSSPFLCQIVGTGDRRSGGLVGSGLRCELRGRRVVVSAAHVFSDGWARYAELAVSAGHGQRPRIIEPERIEVDREKDLAIYVLPADYPMTDADRYWPEARIDRALDRLGSDYLFVHGFPGARSRTWLVPGDSRVMSQSLPYGVMQRLDVRDDLKSFQFAMDFEPENANANSGPPEPALFEEFSGPRGLSGSPVWRIGVSGRRAADWTADCCELVGIVTHWRPDGHYLVATKATSLAELARSRLG